MVFIKWALLYYFAVSCAKIANYYISISMLLSAFRFLQKLGFFLEVIHYYS